MAPWSTVQPWAPSPAQGGEQVFAAAGDLEFLLGAHHQVEARQDALHMGADLGAGDETGLAVGLAGQSPEHRAVIDVQHPLHAVALGIVQGAAAGLEHTLGGEVGTGDQQRLGAGDEGLVDVVRAQRHVGAILAIEHQRKGLAVLDAQQHQGGEALAIHLDAAGVAAFLRQRLGQEAAHVVVADPGQHRRSQPQARGAEGDVGGGSPQVLGEAADVFQRRPYLLRIEVDAQSPQADDIQLAPAGEEMITHGWLLLIVIGQPRGPEGPNV